MESYLERLRQLLYNEKESHEYTLACLSYASQLLENQLPVIFDKTHLSLLIGINFQDLNFFLSLDDEFLYRTIRIPKKHGGFREINLPIFDLKYIQRWILDNILSNLKPSDFAVGFVQNKSIVDNANQHLGASFVFNVDIENFFPSITISTVFRLFHYYGYTKEVSYALAKLCTCNGKLVQGSPASPAISNLVCLHLDKRLSELAKSQGINYSRYADDITFSSDVPLKYFSNLVNKIIQDEGFKVNVRKTRFSSRHQRQEITGLIINTGIPRVPKSFKRKLQQEIYYCKKFGVKDHMQRAKLTKRFYRDHLYGKAYYINMVEPDLGRSLLMELDEINWEE